MTELVDPTTIEEIVGKPRHVRAHWAKAVSEDKKVYLLHSELCVMNYGTELQKCPYSRALDAGVDIREWIEDVPLLVTVVNGKLSPAAIG